MNHARWLLRVSALRLIILLNEKQLLHGVRVVIVAEGAERKGALTKVEAALQLLSEVAPRWTRRLASDCRCMMCLRGVNGLGSYIRSLQVCLVDLDYVNRTSSPEQVAIVLVHEAVHARLHRVGVRRSPSRHARIERACIRAEIRFARRVSGAQALEAWSHERLRLHDCEHPRA